MTETQLTFREAQQAANFMFSELRKLINFNQKELEVFKKGDELELQRLGEKIKNSYAFDNIDIYRINNWEVAGDSLNALASLASLGGKIQTLVVEKSKGEKERNLWKFHSLKNG